MKINSIALSPFLKRNKLNKQENSYQKSPILNSKSDCFVKSKEISFGQNKSKYSQYADHFLSDEEVRNMIFDYQEEKKRTQVIGRAFDGSYIMTPANTLLHDQIFYLISGGRLNSIIPYMETLQGRAYSWSSDDHTPKEVKEYVSQYSYSFNDYPFEKKYSEIEGDFEEAMRIGEENFKNRLNKIDSINYALDLYKACPLYSYEIENRVAKQFEPMIKENRIAEFKQQCKSAPKIIDKILSRYGIKEIETSNKVDSTVSSVISSCDEAPCEKPAQSTDLSNLEQRNQNFIDLIGSSYDAKNGQTFAAVAQKDSSFLDFLLEEENVDKVVKRSSRLKMIWLKSILHDPSQAIEYTDKINNSLKTESELIKLAKYGYQDIIDNDETITDDQRAILLSQTESIPFFKVVSKGVKPNDILQMEVNILNTLETLSNDKRTALLDAQYDIFNRVQDISVLSSEDSDDIKNVDFILNLLKQRADSGSKEEKEALKTLLSDFKYAQFDCDETEFSKNWKKLVVLAQEEFETKNLSDLTNQNIDALMN